MMKKLIYAILICIIIAGIVIIATMGLKADILYSKNVELDIYIGKVAEKKDIENIVQEVFPNERIIVQEVELFNDMYAITLPDTRSDDELNAKVEELNNKINEKYELENKTEDITITHNPKVRLSSIIMPYFGIIIISIILMLIFVAIRYKKLGILKTILSYIISIGAVEMLYLSIIAITRFPINRVVIPVGLLLFLVVTTILGFINERKLVKADENMDNKKVKE